MVIVHKGSPQVPTCNLRSPISLRWLPRPVRGKLFILIAVSKQLSCHLWSVSTVRISTTHPTHFFLLVFVGLPGMFLGNRRRFVSHHWRGSDGWIFWSLLQQAEAASGSLFCLLFFRFRSISRSHLGRLKTSCLPRVSRASPANHPTDRWDEPLHRVNTLTPACLYYVTSWSGAV